MDLGHYVLDLTILGTDAFSKQLLVPLCAGAWGPGGNVESSGMHSDGIETKSNEEAQRMHSRVYLNL